MVRKCNEWGFERLLRVQVTGGHLRVTADNFPVVHDQVRAACDELDRPKRPEIYIAAGGDINAFTANVDRTIIVLCGPSPVGGRTSERSGGSRGSGGCYTPALTRTL